MATTMQTGSRGRQARDRATRGQTRARGERPRDGQADAGGLANALGWFSLGLGIAQIVTPGGVARLIGVNDDAKTRRVMRAVGVREVASGVGILSKDNPAEFVWGRVAGDLMDLAMLGKALRSEDDERDRTSFATAAVLGIGALDYMCAQKLSRGADGATEGARATGHDRQHGIHVRQSIVVNRPIEEVYQFWHDFENLPRFMRHLESVQVLEGRRSHWRAEGPGGMSIEWDAEVVEERPNELIAWRTLPGSEVQNSGVVSFSRAPGGRGTLVSVEVTYDPPGGPIAAKIAKLFRREPGQEIEDDLRAFKQVLETGEVVLSDATVFKGRPHPAQPPEVAVRPQLGSRQELAAHR